MDGLDCFGCVADIGFDYGSIIPTAAGLTSGVITAVQSDEASSKASADEIKKLNAAIKADVDAVTARAKADVSAPQVGKVTPPSSQVDTLAAQTSTVLADRAGAGLSPDSQQKRADAANAALTAAIARSQASPKDPFLAAMVKEWTAQTNKSQNASITADDGGGGKGKKGGKGGSWFTRPVVGRLPGYGVLLVGGGLLGGVGIAVKKIFFK